MFGIHQVKSPLSRYVITCFLALAMLACSIRAAPRIETRIVLLPHDELTSCAPGSPRRDTCERCAKVTKSLSAYPMCCMNVEDEEWCRAFLNFKFES